MHPYTRVDPSVGVHGSMHCVLHKMGRGRLSRHIRTSSPFCSLAPVADEMPQSLVGDLLSKPEVSALQPKGRRLI